ncbi:phospholipid/cholesterol/gamma-HCH transport system substrate-binding protein [Salinimicrobium sediminis]|uniref:Phospholipid/cholesterol/gamma-HCH transport system substrate-binding protein n=1 Tax=Salinimicrobium sediminis TaxID=1343891 RepID=A0A285X8M1_9FLAO|nr:MlaD family protein [Salinimicrobium sediminis]SOC81144.1 phospholipid/cholesterol/gamma-HCH transport system substrate-binding protein [Salinimicrobium sediminis]
MKNSNSQNLRLGIFIIAGILIFVAAVYFIGNRQHLFGNNARISSVFKSVNGLQVGNNVRYAGVNVGTVRDITIVNDTSILVDFIIEEKTMPLIKRNSVATISSDGLVGSMIINLTPGEEFSSETIRGGDTLQSISKVATADMLTTLNTTNENAALLTADLLKITAAINEGKGTLGVLIRDEQMAQDISSSMAELKKTTQGAAITVNKLNRLISQFDMENSVAGVLFKDTLPALKVKEVIVSLEKSAGEIEQMTSNLNKFSEEIINNEGVLDYVLHDSTLVEQINATLENAEAASKKLDENMQALQHNILFRGYFKRQARIKAREEAKRD